MISYSNTKNNSIHLSQDFNTSYFLSQYISYTDVTYVTNVTADVTNAKCIVTVFC